MVADLICTYCPGEALKRVDMLQRPDSQLTKAYLPLRFLNVTSAGAAMLDCTVSGFENSGM